MQCLCFYVHDLAQSVRFYSAMFAAAPTVEDRDYASWQLEDPRARFAISVRATRTAVACSPASRNIKATESSVTVL